MTTKAPHQTGPDRNVPVQTKSKQTLEVLQCGRALAAISVAILHAASKGNAFTSDSLRGVFSWGEFGVDFFFVLSGFIIYHVHGNDERTAGNARIFAIKRGLRVYVPYWPVGIAMIVLYLALPGFSAANRDWSWFRSLTLLPADSGPALLVAWTMTYEILFYVMFLSFFITRHFWVLMAGWGLCVLLHAGTGLFGEPEMSLVKHLLSPLILEFLAGMAAAYLFTRLADRDWLWPLMLGLGGIVAAVLIGDLHRAWIGVSMAPVILGLVLLERGRGIAMPGWVLLLGAASYSIYLVHNPLGSVVARAVRFADNFWVTFFSCLIAGIALGVIYHLLVERPALRTLTKSILGRIRHPALADRSGKVSATS